MLSKEESLKKAKELSYGWHVGDNEFVPLKDVNKLIREIYSIKPYKFEELKEGMWVWDSKTKFIYLIHDTHEEDMKIEVVVNDRDIQYTKVVTLGEFEENRFFPVQMANVWCE